MKTPIDIIKWDEKNTIYFYRVSSARLTSDFYLGIDSQKKKVYFFDSSNFLKMLGFIDFSKADYFIKIPEIDQGILNLVAIKVFKAMQENKFPQDLSILP